MTFLDTQIGRVVVGETDTIWKPRTPRVGTRGVVLFHGQGNPKGWIDPGAPKYAMEMATTLCAAGIPLISAEMHGDAWSNEEGVEAGLEAWAELKLAFPALDTEQFIAMGVSMGGGCATKMAQLHPDKVAAVVGLIPAYDPRACYLASDVGDAAMEAAWDFTDINDFPDGLNFAAHSGDAYGIPHLSCYSSNDSVVPSASVINYHTAVGSSPDDLHNIGALGHDFTGMSIQTVGRFLVAHGA